MGKLVLRKIFMLNIVNNDHLCIHCSNHDNLLLWRQTHSQSTTITLTGHVVRFKKMMIITTNYCCLVHPNTILLHDHPLLLLHHHIILILHISHRMELLQSIVASQNGHTATVDLLLRIGADLSIVNKVSKKMFLRQFSTIMCMTSYQASNQEVKWYNIITQVVEKV